MIHQTAVVHANAELDESVEVGPFAVIGDNVRVHAGTTIGAHVVIDPYVTIGPDCRIFQFAAIGAIPQDLKFGGETTRVEIGRGCVVREFVTIHRGTREGGGCTQIGDGCLLMAYTHVAHDCRIGNHVIMSNAATLAGHIHIGDHATIGGLVAIHQFVRIGAYAFIGGKSAVPKDVPPYVIASGDRVKLHGLNKVGLKRHGFSAETMTALKKTYRIIFRIGITMNEAIERVRAEVDPLPEVVRFLDFIESSNRGITR